TGVGENVLQIKSRLDEEEQITEVKITRQDGKDFRLKSVEYPDGNVVVAGKFKESRRGIAGIAERGLETYSAVYTALNPAATITVTQDERVVAEGVGQVTAKELSTASDAAVKVWDGADADEFLEYIQKVHFRNPLAPNRLYAIMPAPGQFVNEGTQTLTGSADGFGWGEGWATALYASDDDINVSASGRPGISLGSFGGFSIYQFDDPVKNSPNNPFGVDFFVLGNAFIGNNEPAGIMVAKDDGTGKPGKWYNLAGSEHYEDTTDWNYSVTYTNPNPSFSPDLGQSVPWTDSKGNSGFVHHNGWHMQNYYPSPKNYIFDGNAVNDLYSPESMTYTGVNINTLKVNFGYAETTIGSQAEIENFVEGNPYTGAYHLFDISWAVDDNGMPVDLDEISFVKVFTCQLTDGGAVGEKSPEVLRVQRTDKEGTTPVGKTAAPKRITITAEGFDPIELSLQPGKSVYDVDVGKMRFVKLAAEAPDSDNLYINNKKVASGQPISETYEVSKDNPRLVRILNQGGEKEPSIIMLRLTSQAEPSTTFFENMQFGVADSAIFFALSRDTKDGYSCTIPLTQGQEYRNMRVVPHVSEGVTVSVNGSALQEDGTSQPIVPTGELTIIKLTATDGKYSESVELRITQQKPEAEPQTAGSITVTFTLLGAPIHGGAGPMLTYKENKDKLEVWIPQKTYVVPEGSVVLPVFEKALGEAGLAYVNAFGGNYISSITSPKGDELAEFTNGPNSGWMYLVNDEYPMFGLAEFKIKDGDNIVWHYTDDYTREDTKME
ncbi:MAG TPA: DUF4430 domain-containing protein, partial [Negativicutes bacterium]|nr:DUF4430 domain-containing protein [Negativicutes bacterium]